MIMHANEDISCGTELTVAYAGGGNHISRGQSLTRLLGSMICDCKLCELDRADGDEASREREKILTDHECSHQALIRHGSFSSSSALEISYKDCIRAVESTYAIGRGPLRPATFFLHIGLAQVYMDRAVQRRDTSLYEDVRCSLFSSLAVVGVVRQQTQTPRGTYIPIATSNLPSTGAHDDAIIVMVQLAIAYYCEQDRSKAQEWVRAVHWLHAASRGGDTTFFYVRFKDFLSEMGPEILGLFRTVK